MRILFMLSLKQTTKNCMTDLPPRSSRTICWAIYIYLSLFHGHLKLPQATQKGKRSKEGFEVTPQRYFGILQYARRHNHSFSLKQVSHAVIGSLFKAQNKQDPHLRKSCSTWGSIRYLRERKLVDRKTYSLNPFAPPLMKKKQTSKPVMPPSNEKQTELFPTPPTTTNTTAYIIRHSL